MWLMPGTWTRNYHTEADFGFFSWPEPGVGAYTDVRRQTAKYEEELGLVMNGSSVLHDSWGAKTKKLLWRGVPMVEVRQVGDRVDAPDDQDLLRASQGHDWSDVKELNWGAVNQDEEGRKANNGDLRSPAEHCQYAFLAHVEGWAYSGRLK
jgi:hypothetical protein